jgi:putative ABC transport system permease protein
MWDKEKAMRLLRDLGRRKLRSALTITGIMIGIMALVVFGSMANKIDALVKGGSDYYKDKVTVSAKGGMMGIGGVLSTKMVDQIAPLDGVDVVVPSTVLLLSDETSGVSMGTPPMITASVAGADKGRETFKLNYASGRALTAADENNSVVVLGSDLARQKKAKVGDTIQLRNQNFQVVGILEPTLTAPDNSAMVPMSAAQELFIKTMPALVADRLTTNEIATGLTVYPKPGVDPEKVAAEIKASIAGVDAMTGKDFDQQIGAATSMLNAILIGIGLLSLIIGGLSVVNTMAMSVAERTREIGIKRAIGASRWRIRREIVVESAFIGLVGGLLGLGLGYLIVTAGNNAGRDSATILFDLTFGTAFSSVAFATILGALAGFVPAWGASRLDPVTALRYE